MKHIIKELKIVWGIGSLLLLFLVFSFLFFDSITILENAPTCSSIKMLNKECIMCGMTRAFVKCSNLNFSEAYRLNNGSVYLYFITVMNILFYSIYFMKSNNLLRTKIYKNENS